MYDNTSSAKAEEIFYALLKARQLDGNEEMYQNLMREKELMDRVETLAAAFECQLVFYNSAVYLYPMEDNTFLGYSPKRLKDRLLRSNEPVVNYYLQMFIILTILVEFFETEYGDGKLRESIEVSTLINKVLSNLELGVNMEQKDTQIPFQEMFGTFSSLSDMEDNTHDKKSKYGLLMRVFNFLQEQELARYFADRQELRVTPRFGALVQNVLRREEGHDAVLKMMEEIRNA